MRRGRPPKCREQITVRDPEPSNRDPIPASYGADAEARKAEDMRTIRLAVPCVAEGNTLCPECGHNVSRIETTRKYDESEPVLIIRYRTCRRCGHYFASRKVVV
jgi:DNA-directed RNA polymerase subunit M/transcription elongation factor TFIIS